MKKILSIFLVIVFLFTSGCFNLPKRIYSKEELEDGLISVEIARVVENDTETNNFDWITLKILNLAERLTIVKEISKIMFVQATRPPTHFQPSYMLLFIYSDYIVRFSLHYAIGRMDLNGKPIDNSDEYFPTGYNNELAKLIDKYLEQ